MVLLVTKTAADDEGSDKLMPPPFPVRANVIHDDVLDDRERCEYVVGSDSAALVVGNIAADQIALQERPSSCHRNASALSAALHIVIRDGVSDDLDKA